MSNLRNIDYYLEIARGNISGVSYINKYGHNQDVDTTTYPESIWSMGGLWVPPTTARTHDITSTSANDTSAGTGARTIKVVGLDANWVEQEETITMNGVANVATASTYVRIFRMYVVTAGSGEVNAGDITATAQTDATVTAVITTGEGQTLMAVYTVPAGKTAYITHGWVTMTRRGSASGDMAEFKFYGRFGADTATPANRTLWKGGISVTGTSVINLNYSPYSSIPEKTDLWLDCTYVTDNNSKVGAGFDIVLVTN